MHHSIVPDNSQPALPRCTTCCRLFHCPLCPYFLPTALSRLKRHIDVHLKNALSFRGKKICKCHLDCRPDGHFHCPQCEKTIIRKDTMAHHLLSCEKAPVTSSELASVHAESCNNSASSNKSVLSIPATSLCPSVISKNYLVLEMEPDRDPECRKLTNNSKHFINIGEAFSRWRDFKERKSLSTDAEVAIFLLDVSQEVLSSQENKGTSRVSEQLENCADPGPSNEGKVFYIEHEESDCQSSQMDREIDQKHSASTGIAGVLGLCEVEAGGLCEVEAGGLCEVEGVEKAMFKAEGPMEYASEFDREEEETDHPGGGAPWQKPTGGIRLDIPVEDGHGSSPPSSQTDQQGLVAGPREPGSTQQKPPMILCPECGILYSTRLQDYRRCEHNFTVCCQECGKLFVSESGLMLHQKLHSQDYSFPCKFCLQPFTTRLDKLTHEKGHRFKEKEPPYSCSECTLKFHNILVRSRHLKEHRSKRHICHVCYKEFNQGRLLERHAWTHSDVKPFKCQVCQRSFAQASRLKSHVRVHTGRRPFQCRHCHKSFSYNFSLKNHIQRYHGPDSVVPPDGLDRFRFWTECRAGLGGGVVRQRKPLQQVELAFRTAWPEADREDGQQWKKKCLSSDEPLAKEHHSIVPDNSQPSLPRCTTCCKLFHCPLCLQFKPTALSRLKRHINVHLKNALSFKGKKICKCNLLCRTVGHFHCPKCKRTIIRKNTMARHLLTCQDASADVTSSELASIPHHDAWKEGAFLDC
ncbi:zinc finger protein 16 isoform X2 [Esox lucius]|uniref:zinc finger protein 16 isoform X2 n=1 Tax=Esox lucius TaxID=8010 RepID=UPI0014770C0B|nr:zinc finger protein 16 isoform X2 [Esox lucius]